MTEQEHIKKGFNAGYQMEKLAPKLSKALEKGLTDKKHPFTKGFSAGRQEFVNEQSKQKTSSLGKYIAKPEQQKGQPKTNNKDIDFER
jgi:hypothetical protein